MRKNQDGYILVYVLVVILALSMFAVGLTSHALKNHNIQKNAVAYTQDKYAAEGMIEQFVAELEASLAVESLTIEPAEGTSDEQIQDKVNAGFKSILSECVDSIIPDDQTLLRAEASDYCVSIEAGSGQITINTAIEIKLKIIEDNNNPLTYTIENVKTTYTSYEITRGEALE